MKVLKESSFVEALYYLNVPGVNPALFDGRQRYIPTTCTLSPGYKGIKPSSGIES